MYDVVLEYKVLQTISAHALEQEMNRFAREGWVIAPGAFQVARKTEGNLSYRVIMERRTPRG